MKSIQKRWDDLVQLKTIALLRRLDLTTNEIKQVLKIIIQKCLKPMKN